MKSANPAAHILLLIPLVEQSMKKGLCLISASFPLSLPYTTSSFSQVVSEAEEAYPGLALRIPGEAF